MTLLPILMYHSIDDSGSVVSTSPKLFADQVGWLAQNGWRCTALQQACEYRKTHGDWPSHTVVMTFDDAYENVSTMVLPRLAEHSFSATIFVVTGYVGKLNDWALPPDLLGTQRIMNWSQVEQAHLAGMEIAAHTQTHPNLVELSIERVDDELGISQEIIEQHIGQPVVSFAHPFGCYNNSVEAKAREYFVNVCTTSLSRADSQPDFALPRVDMYYVRSMTAFERLVMGSLDTYLTVRRWGRSLKQVLSKHDHAVSK